MVVLMYIRFPRGPRRAREMPRASIFVSESTLNDSNAIMQTSVDLTELGSYRPVLKTVLNVG